MATLSQRLRLTLACAFSLIAMVCMCTVLAQPAQAKDLVFQSGVSDDVTRFEVSKLDPQDHSFVAGAHLAIIDYATGKIVDGCEWVSPTHGSKLIAQKLNVNTKYILREISAPDGYAKAQDVVFVVNPSEEEGITILSGGSYCEQTGAFSINLYDTRLPIEVEETQYVNRSVAPKTGDDTPFGLVAAIGTGALIGIVVLQFMKPRKKDKAQS